MTPEEIRKFACESPGGSKTDEYGFRNYLRMLGLGREVFNMRHFYEVLSKVDEEKIERLYARWKLEKED